MAERGDFTRIVSLAHRFTRSPRLVTRLPFLLRDNSAFEVDGSEFAGSPWATESSSF